MFDNILCYIQVPRPKVMKREQAAPQLLELLANDRQSQAGHMLNNLSTDSTALIREVSARTCVKVKNQHDMNAILFFLLYRNMKSPKCYQTAVPATDTYFFAIDRTNKQIFT